MVDVQGLKDTFYQVLRDRIAAGNAARTVVIRGVLRPAVVVIENELPGAAVDGVAWPDAFCLHWTGLRLEDGALSKAVLGCEIRYATDGTAEAGGLDRGRLLAAMDRELGAALESGTHMAAGITVSENVSGAAIAVGTGTNIFWGELLPKPTKERDERLERSVEIEVFGYGD